MLEKRVASGFCDYPPRLAAVRWRVVDAFRRVAGRFGFDPIDTPHIERLEVLRGKGAVGEEVLRHLFEVQNTGGEAGKFGLRFDLTVPLARFVAAHIDEIGVPLRRYACGSVFRGERPAK